MFRFALIIAFVFLVHSVPSALGQDAVNQDKLNSDLKYAAINEDKLAVRELLQQGADANMTEGNGRSPLRTAVSKGNLGIVKLLVEAGADVNASHPMQPRSILAEAAAGQLSKSPTDSLVRYLLGKGAKPDAIALAMASSAGNPETVQLLLDAGISPDEGLTAASESGHVGIIEQLLKAGADANGKTDHPPLSSAASRGWEAAVETLLKAGANPNVVDSRGDVPLHDVVSGTPNLSVVKRLVESGARIDIANDEGITPIREASIRGSVDIYDWFLKQCGGTEPPPSNIEDEASVDTEQLLSQLRDKDEEKRKAAQRLLVGRGDSIMPAVLERIEATGINSAFGELLAAMGPPAKKAIPYIDSLLDDEQQVFGALLTLSRMDPRGVERLPVASKQLAAESLVKGIHEHTEDVYAPFLMGMLVGLGEDATPELLQFLEGDNPGLRAGAARKLQHAGFNSQRIEEKLIDILLHDPILGVREHAARGLQNPRFRSQEARRALIEVLATPRIELDSDIVRNGPEEERKKMHQERKAIEDLLREASWALATYGPSLIPELRDRLAQADETTRANYHDVYDHLDGNPETVAAFAKLLNDSNDAVRESAHDQMARLAAQHSVEAGDLLLQRYSDGNAKEQKEAARALVRISVGRKAPRYLPHQLTIVGDAGLDRRTRMLALGSALRIDAEAVKQSEQAAEFVAVLIDEINSGEYTSRLHAMKLVGELGSTATSAKELLESLISKPLPKKPDTLSRTFRFGIDDQPGSAYQEFAREQHAAKIIRQQASESLKAIKADSMQ